jgi:hypothetical protein
VVATRAEFVTRFATAWRNMGFTGPILVPQECANLPAGISGTESGSFQNLLPRAHMFIFEFGLATQGQDEPLQVGRRATSRDQECLSVTEKLFRQIVALEDETRPAGHGLPRRVIGVNVIHNCYWSLFSDYVSANINPFCGHVLAGIPRAVTSTKEKIARQRDRRMPSAELSAALRVASGAEPDAASPLNRPDAVTLR